MGSYEKSHYAWTVHMLNNPLLFLNNDISYFIGSVGGLASSKLLYSYNVLSEVTKLRNFNMCELQC